uniref:family 43 glycosylhydrolase n=1 Tax=Herbidospora sakaeratensis TaxID=564415 RepID=UPI000785AF98|nr:family 43 glycosylhydrolase [Herbidospora sakaeratensis]
MLVLRGSHPDPSILRVGADYYVATSTFEWRPGVRLHHSRDLVNWRCLGGALHDDLTGVPDSGGIWAPDLSYADGLFYLVYTDVRSFGGFWDTPNFVVTTERPGDRWSAPVPLHARGFDPSLFHDDDGRSWLLSNQCEWRPGRPWAGGIIAQEFSRADGKLIGPPELIFEGTSAGFTEGPRLYRRDGWYYLVTAEGGTGWDHQVTVARSRTLTGPYTASRTVLTAKDDPAAELQKTGHASFVDTPEGDWRVAYLASRPLTPRGACILGRETVIAPLTWEDGWPQVGGELPVPPAPHAEEPEGWRHSAWSTLRRTATDDWLTVDGDALTLRGGQSPWSAVAPSLYARRVTDHRFTFAADVESSPGDTRRLAGVTAYYNMDNWYFLAVTEGRLLLLASDRAEVREVAEVPLSTPFPVRLRLSLDQGDLRFAYAVDGQWHEFPQVLDATILSDDYATFGRRWGFTGAFAGVWAWDLTGEGTPATFRAYETT